MENNTWKTHGTDAWDERMDERTHERMGRTHGTHAWDTRMDERMACIHGCTHTVTVNKHLFAENV